MDNKRLKYISSMILGIILMITLLMMFYIAGYYRYLIAITFFIINLIKDYVMHKLGFNFNGFGFKKMMIVDIIALLLVIVLVGYKMMNTSGLVFIT